MVKHKAPRNKGKVSFKNYFQTFKAGDKVAVAKELAVLFSYSNRLQGRTGTIIEKRGTAYEVDVPDLGKSKTYFIKPVHLKKIAVI